LKYNEAVYPLFIDLRWICDSVRRELLHNILIEFRLIKMLNDTYSKARIGEHLSESFPIQNGLKQDVLYYHSFSTLLWNMPSGRSRETMWDLK
jgi:hypothetical protein